MESETIVDTYARLNKQGYTGTCRAEEQGMKVITQDRSHQATCPADQLEVDDVIRLEGTSSPSEEVVIFAMRTADDRWKGTWCVTHGPQLSAVEVSMMQALNVRGARRSGKKVS